MNLERIKNMSVQTKAALVFTIATFVCKGINFITLPLFTRILTTEQMGIVTTFNSWQVLLVVFANLSLDSGSFNIAMMEYRDKRYSYMSSILLLSTVSSVVVAILYFFLKSILQPIIGIDDSLMLLMFVGFVFLPATTFWMLHQRYTYKYKSTALVTLLSTGLSVVISAIVTLIASRKGYDDLASVRLISSNAVLILWGLFFYLLIFKRGRTGYKKEYWKFVLVVNTPLMFHSLAKHILDVSDRTMISNMVGKSEVGIYGVLFSVSALALIVWSAINASLIPYMFESLKQGKQERISKFVELMLLTYSVACICLTLAAPELVRILATDEYMEAVYLMPPIAAGIFFTALYNVYSNLLLYYKKTSYIMLATFCAAIFNIAANYYFIQLYGYQAAAYTTLASYIILALMQFLFLKKLTKSEKVFNDKRLWIISILTAVVCILINALYGNYIVRYSVISIILIVAIIFRKRLIRLYKRLKQ